MNEFSTRQIESKISDIKKRYKKSDRFMYNVTMVLTGMAVFEVILAAIIICVSLVKFLVYLGLVIIADVVFLAVVLTIGYRIRNGKRIITLKSYIYGKKLAAIKDDNEKITYIKQQLKKEKNQDQCICLYEYLLILIINSDAEKITDEYIVELSKFEPVSDLAKLAKISLYINYYNICGDKDNAIRIYEMYNLPELVSGMHLKLNFEAMLLYLNYLKNKGNYMEALKMYEECIALSMNASEIEVSLGFDNQELFGIYTDMADISNILDNQEKVNEYLLEAERLLDRVTPFSQKQFYKVQTKIKEKVQ